MSRSGYNDDGEGSNLALGALASAIRGKRGQALLRDFVAALDAMPEKRLGHGALKDADGCRCSLGVVADARGLDMGDVAFEEWDGSPSIGHKVFAARFDVSEYLTREVMFWNDEGGPWNSVETPEQRWTRMRQWAVANLKGPQA